MSSEVTSFVGLFEHGDAGGVARVEIPLIQRDYAQGRQDATTSRIRRRFLEALRTATTGEESQ